MSAPFLLPTSVVLFIISPETIISSFSLYSIVMIIIIVRRLIVNPHIISAAVVFHLQLFSVAISIFLMLF